MASLLFGLYSSVAELCHVIAIKYFPSNADNNRLQSVSSPSLWRIALDERKRREAGPTNCPLAGTSEDIICNDNHSTGEIDEEYADMMGADGGPLTDPTIIYSCPVMTTPREGLSFYVRGRVLKTCERFSINLSVQNEKRDIALHFNPRLPQNYVVRNSRINGSWGDEERCSALPFSLHRNSNFLIQILVTEKAYLISINGRHFALYTHRVPLQAVKTVDVRGDVTDVSCEQAMITEYPEPAPQVQEIVYVDDTREPVEPAAAATTDDELAVPFFGKLKQPFDSGHVLHISGRLKVLPDSFYLNLQSSSKIWPHSNIHFHFNPRFAITGSGKHILCCNSWLASDWGQEERSEISYKEFYPGKRFQLRFQRTYSSYMVFMNDQLINTFRFRDDGDLKPDTVYIQGDFVINEIFVSNSYETYPVEEE